MGVTKNEIALLLATSILVLFIATSAIGIGTGFVFGDIKINQEHFDEAWDFGTIFAGASLMYFGFRAGQANGTAKTQS
jgi:hypothetical protein